MWTRSLALFTIFALVLINAPAASADTVKFADGRELDGVIKKIEAGRVYILAGEEERVFDILEIASMDFNTPHLLSPSPDLPIDHFLKNMEAQEMVRNVGELQKASADIRKMLDQIRGYWVRRQPIDAADVMGWEAAKRDFRKPLDRYQELLNDMYFHVLSQVDEYNAMAKEASKIYIGVRGIRTGSPLISKEMEKLPLKKYVPATWYDTIYYDGYNIGYQDAYIKFTVPRSYNQ